MTHKIYLLLEKAVQKSESLEEEFLYAVQVVDDAEKRRESTRNTSRKTKRVEYEKIYVEKQIGTRTDVLKKPNQSRCVDLQTIKKNHLS